MEQAVYVAHRDDLLASGALMTLQGFGAVTSILSGTDPTACKTDIVLFSGRQYDVPHSRQAYPSRCLRKILLPHDAEQRGFVIPSFARGASALFALKPGASASSLEEALRQIYYMRTGIWTGPKPTRKNDWRSGHQARKEREHFSL
jgi:hypothetical protein